VQRHRRSALAPDPALDTGDPAPDPGAPAHRTAAGASAPDDPWFLDATAWLAEPEPDAAAAADDRRLGRPPVEQRAEHIHAASRAAAIRFSRR